jgi:hypothetical protein
VGLESNDDTDHCGGEQEGLSDADDNAKEEGIRGDTDCEEDGEMIQDWDDEDKASW